VQLRIERGLYAGARETTRHPPVPGSRGRGQREAARAETRRARRGEPRACDNRRVFAPAPAPHGANPYLLLTLTPLVSSSNWVIDRGLSADVPPMATTFLRWLFALLMLAPFAWPHVRREWRSVRRNWKTMLFLGAVGVGTHNALAYLGLNYTTATNGLIVNSLIPVMIIAMSWGFLGERLAPFHVAGIALILTGIGLTSRLGRHPAPMPAGTD